MKLSISVIVLITAFALLAEWNIDAEALPPPGSKNATAAKSNGKRPFGIAKRVPWTTSRVTGSLEPPPPYQLERVFPKLEFNRPGIISNAPGTERLFVVELKGLVVSFPLDQNCEQPDVAIHLAQHVKKLDRVYGLAFHPNFATNRLCYICYVLDGEPADGTHVSRFKVSDTDPPVIDGDSKQIIIQWQAGGHNGGCLKFGPDGFLYISTGDGSGAFPPDTRDTGQRVDDLLASILRIDVDHPADGNQYSIPKDNPFVNLDGARGEVWSYGHRNPWKMSFDPATGALWVGDVGWEMWEMIYRIEKGGNYGWSLFEATQVVHPERLRGPTPILPPTIKHSHTESRSITGGYTYHGKRLKELTGAYIYGDYVTGKIWGARHDGKQITWLKELADSPTQMVGFGVDNKNELYVLGYDGTIHRLIPNSKQRANQDFPKKLSDTGLFAAVQDHALAAGVIPYSINAEPWADHGTAQRFIAVPESEQLDVHESQNVQIGDVKGAWKFPSNTVLAKTMSLEMKRGESASQRRLETQILHRDGDTWRAYNYIWNDEQTDATLAEAGGFDRTYEIVDAQAPGGHTKQTWHFASRSECILCHTTRAGSVHGFILPQLNRDHDYGDVTDNQIRTLSHIGLFTKPPKPKTESDDLPIMPNPYDRSADLETRTRSYLHVNCGHCHRRGGGGTAAMDVRFEFTLKQTNLLNARPTQGTFGIHAPQVLPAGDPYRSVLFYRMSKLGRGRMPHFGSNVVDETGLKLIHDWIAQLQADADDKSATAATTAKLRKSQQASLRQLTATGKDDKASADSAVDQLLASTSGALMLAHTLNGNTDSLTEAVRDLVVAKATAHADVQIRDLFERFLPEDKRVKRLGTAIKPESILALKGNANTGEQLFAKAAGVQCRNCHRIKKTGKELGPDLTKIGKKYNRAQLLETILQPSKVIDPKFMTYIVETKQGRVHTGLLAKRTAEEVILKDATSKQIRIAADNVEVLVPQRKSLMPELLLRDMTAQEVADLLDYLDSLK